ncbi:MAG: hypothetical protein Kow0062_26850 [Acidobacteriota bacterium]
MRGARTLPLVVLILAAASAGRGDAIRIVEPRPGLPIEGRTTLAFSVIEDGTPVERIEVYESGRWIATLDGPPWRTTWDAPRLDRPARFDALAFGGGRVLDRVRLVTAPPKLVTRVEVRRVQFYPIVLDRSGRPVRGLDADDFTVRDGRTTVDVRVESGDAAPLELDLLLDASDSVRDEIDDLRRASIGFLRHVTGLGRVSVHAFNETLRPIVPPTADVGRAVAGLETIRAGGATALYDALHFALASMGARSGRKALVLFSDGVDRRSLFTLEQVVDEALASDVVVFAIAPRPRTVFGERREDLARLTEETGGRLWLIERGEELGGVYEELQAHLAGQYAVSWTPPDPGPGVHEVRIRVRGGRVRCRTSYRIEPEPAADVSSPRN